jgi:6,7-dimethyl-8-ribityllumazine synthase
MLAEFSRQKVAAKQVDVWNALGAFEIPVMVKKLALTRRYDAIVACALVVNGGIYRHEFVTPAAIDGLMRVQPDIDVPVFSAALTAAISMTTRSTSCTQRAFHRERL